VSALNQGLKNFIAISIWQYRVVVGVAAGGANLPSPLLQAAYAVVDHKANRVYYCFDFDYLDRSTGQIVTGSSACDDTMKECKALRERELTRPPVVVVSAGECYKYKDVNPHNPK
jgi:hypothetical protein